MSTEVAIPKSTALTVVQRAVTAIGFTEEKKEELRVLAKSTADITKITNADGREQVHRAYMVLKNKRCEIEGNCKDVRDDATKFSKAVIGQEKEIVAIISPEETRLEGLRDGWDQKLADEKQAKIDAEIKRVAEIDARIEFIRNWPTQYTGKPSALIEQQVKVAADYTVGDFFAEKAEQAKAVLDSSRAALAGILAERKAHEAEQARIVAERAELEVLRKQQAERDRLERERIAAEEKAAKVLRDADAAKQAEDLRKLRQEHEEIQHQANEKLAAERKAQQEENERVAAAQAAVARSLAAERAALEREQQSERIKKQAEEGLKAEQQRIANVQRPTDEAIISVLASHYSVPHKKVISWLATYRHQEAA